MPESILRRIAEGDRAAVRECIDRHGGLVWSLARRFSTGTNDAEDAVQEIFIDLWTNAGRYDPSLASETTFVAMLARRTLIDRRRKIARQRETVPIPDDLACRSAEEPSEQLERLDEVGRAARGLSRLSDNQRKVLTLSIYQGLTYDQIARVMGFPLGTVKTHARRGLLQLRHLLGAGGRDDQDPALPATPISYGGDT